MKLSKKFGMAFLSAASAALIGTAAPAASAAPTDTTEAPSGGAAAIQEQIVTSGKDEGVVLAGTGFSRCPSGYLCLFSGRGGSGHMAYFKWGSPNLRNQNINNATSSYWNRTYYNFRAYMNFNYRGESMLLKPSHRGIDLNWASYENEISSVRAV